MPSSKWKARGGAKAATNRPTSRTRVKRVEKAAQALMSDFKKTDLHPATASASRAPDIFASGGGTPAQQVAAQGVFKQLSANITAALGIGSGRVNANLGDGLIHPETGKKMFGRNR